MQISSFQKLELRAEKEAQTCRTYRLEGTARSSSTSTPSFYRGGIRGPGGVATSSKSRSESVVSQRTGLLTLHPEPRPLPAAASLVKDLQPVGAVNEGAVLTSCWSVWAPLTEHHGVGSFISHSSGGWKSKIRHQRGSGEGPLPAGRVPTSPRIPAGRVRDGGCKLSLQSSYQGTNPIREGASSRPYLLLVTPRGLPSKYRHTVSLRWARRVASHTEGTQVLGQCSPVLAALESPGSFVQPRCPGCRSDW